MAKLKTTVDPPVDVEGLSRELRRFQLLIRLMTQYAGVNMPELAKRTGIEYTHLTKLVKPNGRSYTGLSADIVRKVKDGLNISPDIFFDDELIAVRSEAELLNVYSMDEARKKQWMRTMEERMNSFDQFRIESRAELLEMRATLERKDLEINRLKHELAQARLPRTRQPR
jgi:transcriptional regulator with XRE-family HTH domain